jgi:prepilin-type N-terminal cleavage/methylation domain-containing protein
MIGAREMFWQEFKTRNSDNESGFSIIEMLVAIVVLTVGLVSIVGISVYVSRANSTSNEINVLAAAAQDQVDRIRTAVWTRTTEDPIISLGGTLEVSMSSTPPDETPSTMSVSDSTSTPMSTSSSTSSGYQYKFDPENPHQATVVNTPVGDLNIRWSVRQGGTPDLRYVTIKVTPVLYSRYLKDGFSVSTIINRN